MTPTMIIVQILLCFVFPTASGTRVRDGAQLDEAMGSIAFLHRVSHFSVSYEHAQRLCNDNVVKGASDVLGSSPAGETYLTSPSHLAEILAASDAEVDALLHALFGDALHGGQHFDLRAFCEKAVLHIPSILCTAAPQAPGLGCIDDACGGNSVDVSEESLALGDLTTVPTATGSDVNRSMELEPAGPDSPEEIGRDLFRRALNVLFGIFPSVNENDEESPSSLLEEEATQPGRNHEPAVAFGPRVREDRHDQYREYVVKASAWIATALRRLKSGRSLVQKWFILHSDSQVDSQISEARKHLTKMLAATGRMLIKKGVPKGEPRGVCSVENGAGTVAYVWTSRSCDVKSRYDCGEKESGRYVINICEFYWRFGMGESTRIGTVVHEASHHFGTNDNGYCEMVDCLSLSSSDARNNADSYTHFVKELVRSSWMVEESLPSDLVAHEACNTPCNPVAVQGNFGEWKFKTKLPSRSCGECVEIRNVALGPINLFGQGCQAGFTEVQGGIAHKLCCKPHECTTPTTTTTTTLGCPFPATRQVFNVRRCNCPGGHVCSKNGRDAGCGFGSDKVFDVSCRTCQCLRKEQKKKWWW
eukprot:TRINITY_DN24376_c0_g1_i1.p1 TRINITY_DN24376_c0_g1~~TRINITY_DN24376_c0_g1_i1.p1  ORF type:complete len:589 (+),score=72.60 TRINITY_DN24376_c0_g1_i1:80-1846(+)